jgi:hypothetical protein
MKHRRSLYFAKNARMCFGNVIHPEAGHTRKRDSPSHYFRDKSNFLYNVNVGELGQ